MTFLREADHLSRTGGSGLQNRFRFRFRFRIRSMRRPNHAWARVRNSHPWENNRHLWGEGPATAWKGRPPPPWMEGQLQADMDWIGPAPSQL
eukprot:6815283-Pyramimonas_sp.AAC.1